MIGAGLIVLAAAAAPVATEGDECPAMDLGERVGEYLGGAEVTEPVTATLVREGDVWRLSLVVGGAQREFRAPHCETVVDAGAFLIAVTVDPTVAERPTPPVGGGAAAAVREPAPKPEPEPESEPEPGPKPGPEPKSESESDSEPEPGPKPDPESRSEPDPAPAPSSAAPTPGKLPVGLITGVELGLDGGALPVVGFLVRPWIGIGASRWRAAVTGIFRTRSRATAGGDSSIGGDIGAWAVGARGCGLPRLARERLELPLCGGVEAGRVIGTGFGFDGATDTAITWLGITVGAALTYRPVPALGLSIGGEAGVAPLQGELVIEGLGTIHRIGPVFGRLLGGIEVRFGALSRR